MKVRYVANRRADDGTSSLVLESGSVSQGEVGEASQAEVDSLSEFYVLEEVSDSEENSDDEVEGQPREPQGENPVGNDPAVPNPNPGSPDGR